MTPWGMALPGPCCLQQQLQEQELLLPLLVLLLLLCWRHWRLSHRSRELQSRAAASGLQGSPSWGCPQCTFRVVQIVAVYQIRYGSNAPSCTKFLSNMFATRLVTFEQCWEHVWLNAAAGSVVAAALLSTQAANGTPMHGWYSQASEVGELGQ
jgi:hypothetical protein